MARMLGKCPRIVPHVAHMLFEAKMKLLCEAEVVRIDQENGKTKLGTKIISQELQALHPSDLKA